MATENVKTAGDSGTNDPTQREFSPLTAEALDDMAKNPKWRGGVNFNQSPCTPPAFRLVERANLKSPGFLARLTRAAKAKSLTVTVTLDATDPDKPRLLFEPRIFVDRTLYQSMIEELKTTENGRKTITVTGLQLTPNDVRPLIQKEQAWRLAENRCPDKKALASGLCNGHKDVACDGDGCKDQSGQPLTRFVPMISNIVKGGQPIIRRGHSDDPLAAFDGQPLRRGAFLPIGEGQYARLTVRCPACARVMAQEGQFAMPFDEAQTVVNWHRNNAAEEERRNRLRRADARRIAGRK